MERWEPKQKAFGKIGAQYFRKDGSLGFGEIEEPQFPHPFQLIDSAYTITIRLACSYTQLYVMLCLRSLSYLENKRETFLLHLFMIQKRA